MAVTGINGIGKSTLLRSLCGIQPTLSGEITIGNKQLSDISSKELSEMVSVVLTNQPLSKNLSVFELVALGRQPYTNWLGRLSPADREKTETAILLTDIEMLRDRKCYELSDGQFQRVLIARALSQDTPVIILDEPTSHLDMYHKAQVLRLLKDLSRQTGKAIIFATHEINLAIQLCDQIIVIQEQKVLQGTPGDLIEKKVFHHIFPPDIVFFDGESNSFKIK